MAESLDTLKKQLSSSVDFNRGMLAFVAASTDREQRALDACVALEAERDDYKNKYENKCEEFDDKCEECDRWKEEALRLREELKQARQPKIDVRLSGKAKVGKFITGNLTELYAKDDSNTRQQHKRISVGG